MLLCYVEDILFTSQLTVASSKLFCFLQFSDISHSCTCPLFFLHTIFLFFALGPSSLSERDMSADNLLNLYVEQEMQSREDLKHTCMHKLREGGGRKEERETRGRIKR